METTVVITITGPGDKLAQLQVDPQETVENLKALIEAEMGIKHAQQSIYFNHKLLDNATTLQAAGIKNNDMLSVRVPMRPATSSGRSKGQIWTASCKLVVPNFIGKSSFELQPVSVLVKSISCLSMFQKFFVNSNLRGARERESLPWLRALP